WAMISDAIRFAWSIGMAKPRPMLPPWEEPAESPADSVAMALLTPITAPPESSSGPPELPGLIAASVWMASMRSSALPEAAPAAGGGGDDVVVGEDVAVGADDDPGAGVAAAALAHLQRDDAGQDPRCDGGDGAVRATHQRRAGSARRPQRDPRRCGRGAVGV